MRWYGSNKGWCYYMERDDGGSDIQDTSAHCLACAYVDVITKYGGDCDLRGLRQSPCSQFLTVLVRQERDRLRTSKAAKLASALPALLALALTATAQGGGR